MYIHLPAGSIRCGWRYRVQKGSVVIDIGAGGGYFTIFFGHNVDEAFIQQKAENVGYKLIERHDFLQEQSFNVFNAE